MVLYVKCCPREESRTDKLAKALLERLGDYEELDIVKEDLTSYTEEDVKKRDELLANKDYDNPMFKYARQFAGADTIVIAAPYWDLSFPSKLKVYIENIYATGIVSTYGEDGRPVGLCKASKLYYVTTAGGPYDKRYSFEYIKTMATDYFGIDETELIYADMLDIVGTDADKIISDNQVFWRG